MPEKDQPTLASTELQSQSSLGHVLSQVVTLAPDELIKVQSVIDALLQSQGYARESVESDASDEMNEVVRWREEIRGKTRISQLELIERALPSVEDQGAAEYLTREQRLLLDEEPRLAVKLAIYKMAKEMPVKLTLGVLGLLLAVGTVAVRGFHILF